MKIVYDKPTKGRKIQICEDLHLEIMDIYQVLEVQADLNDMQVQLNCKYKEDLQKIVNYVTQLCMMIVGAMILLAAVLSYAIYIK